MSDISNIHTHKDTNTLNINIHKHYYVIKNTVKEYKKYALEH